MMKRKIFYYVSLLLCCVCFSDMFVGRIELDTRNSCLFFTSSIAVFYRFDFVATVCEETYIKS